MVEVISSDDWEKRDTRVQKLVGLTKQVVETWQEGKLKADGARVYFNPSVNSIYFFSQRRTPIVGFFNDPCDMEIDVIQNGIFVGDAEYLSFGCDLAGHYKSKLNEDFAVVKDYDE